MSKFSIRKDNIGSAIIRFLIGVLILAILIWALFEFVLNGEFDLSGNKPATNGVQPLTSANLTTEMPTEGPTTAEPTAWTQGTVISIPTQEVTATPSPTPTATPTATPSPTPTPAPTPIPKELFAARYKEYNNVKNWGIKQDKVDNGLTRFEIPMANSGKVISLTGWGFATDKYFDGDKCDIYIMFLDKKNNMRLYKANRVDGATGMTHVGAGKNLEKSDFTAIIDISDFADGDYQIGVAISYKRGDKVNRVAYTFGDAYNFTAVGGMVTAVNGIEQ